MNINLKIGRLILDGWNIEPGQRHLVKAAVERELTHLLTDNGLARDLQIGGAMPEVRPMPMRIAKDANPSSLGQAIGRAIYGGIGK